MTWTYDELYMYPPDGDPYQVGWIEWGESKGTRYKKLAGTQTITLTCTPAASVQVNNGMCFAEVRYGVSIMVPRIELLGTTRFLNPHSIKFLTGQRIRATLGMPNPLGLHPALGVEPGSYLWSLSNDGVESFKDYVTGHYLGKKYPLLDSDKRQEAFHFYTNKNGTTQVVLDFRFINNNPDEVHFAGGLPDFQVKSKEIESVRPEYVTCRSVNSGFVLMTVADIWYGWFNGNPPGQVWEDVQLQIPEPFPQVGTGCFAQLITADRHLWRTVVVAPDYTHFIKDPWNAQEALDQAFPYWGIMWNLPDTGTFQDSPKQPLGVNWSNTHYWFKSTVNDTFRTWAMYKPPQKDGQPTVWIPMAQFAWTWSAVAERDPYPNGNWVLISGSGQVTQAPTQTFDFPEWNKFSPGQFGFVPIN